MKIAYLWDRLGIAMSLVCLIHCLLLPVAVIALPLAATQWMHANAFHLVMAFALLPVALIAMVSGMRFQGRYSVAGGIVAGLSLISTAAFAGERWLTPGWEFGLTVVGGAILVAAHGLNYRLSRSCPACSEHSHSGDQS